MILVIRMYQEPMDMIAMMISVPLATKSPVFHNASRPYGFSITSFAGAADTSPGAAAGADASVAGAVAEAAGAAVDAAEAGSSAKTGAATVALNARRAVARNAEKRDSYSYFLTVLIGFGQPRGSLRVIFIYINKFFKREHNGSEQA